MIIEDKSLSEVLAIKDSTKITKSEPADAGPLKLKVYKKRWLMLIIYIIYNAVNSLQWLEYSIITNIITRYYIFYKIRSFVCKNIRVFFCILFRYYGVSSLMVNWTSMSYMAFYVVFIFPVSYVIDRCGLRWTIIVGAGLNCLGSWIKMFSIQPNKFYVAFIGHSAAAFAQVTALNLFYYIFKKILIQILL